jgi:hypothetical protein
VRDVLRRSDELDDFRLSPSGSTPRGRVIGEILPLAAAIVIPPVPVIASVLLLMSAGGRAKGLAFVLGGWCG